MNDEARQVEEAARQLLAERDAEIQRLKEENRRLTARLHLAARTVRRLATLLSETLLDDEEAIRG